jgi:hypothetical protein
VSEVVGVARQVRGALDALRRALDELEPRTLDADGAKCLVELLAEGEHVCAAEKVRVARRVEETGAYRSSGHRSSAHWLADATGITVGAATASFRTAERLDALPVTAAAFRSGRLSETQASAISIAATADPSSEARLLEVAKRSSIKGLKDRCRDVTVRATDDAELAARLHEARFARDWRDELGALRLEASLAPGLGSKAIVALHAETDRMFREAQREGRHEPRDAYAYAADALVQLMLRGPSRPVVMKMTADAAALDRGWAEGAERCEVDGLGPVPVTAARSLLADAKIRVAVREGTEITTISSLTRTIPAALRAWLETTYPVCAMSGCDSDFYLQIDHIEAFADDGPASRDNTWRLCPHHHGLKTNRGWRVVGGPGTWDLVPP